MNTTYSFARISAALKMKVEDLHRGNRLGARLLAMAEEEGKRRGCAVIALFTLHFQAPGFYQKQGYEVAATLETPPPGATRFLMRKQL